MSIINDWLGTDSQRRIEASGVREVFTPHKPVADRNLLVGRDSERKSIQQGLATPGQHVIVYGERGVGKSSLANVALIIFSAYVKGGSRVVIRCDEEDTFSSIVSIIYDEFDLAFEDQEKSREHEELISAEANAGFAKGGGSSKRKTTIKGGRLVAAPETPSKVARRIAHLTGVVVIDEFDAIRKEDRHRLARLVKQLSDAGSELKLLLVGIADSCHQLTGGHKSSLRCLRQVRLNRMTDREILGILEKGFKRTKRVAASESLMTNIVDLAAGYPYFAHLLGLKCAEWAVLSGERYLSDDALPFACHAAVEEVEESLRDSYERAVRSSKSSLYRDILEAAADFGEMEFSSGGLKRKLDRRLQTTVKPTRFSSHLRRLIGNDGDRVLRRVARGVYRFTDPRMRSYVLIARRRERIRVMTL